MTKTYTSKKKLYQFHGNSKSSRIKRAVKIVEKVESVVCSVVVSRGIYDSDSRNIQRYAKAIKKTKKRERVKVTRKS